jgi:hypothetical protein
VMIIIITVQAMGQIIVDISICYAYTTYGIRGIEARITLSILWVCSCRQNSMISQEWVSSKGFDSKARRRKIMKIAIVSAMLILAISGMAIAELLLGQYQNQPLTKSNRAIESLAFVQNMGQWDSRVGYRAETGGAVFYFCRDEVAYMFIRNTDQLEESPAAELGITADKFGRPIYKHEAIMIKARFVGASSDVDINGSDMLAQRNNYFLGNNPDNWHTRVPCFGSITYNDIYPGIDLQYYGNGRSLKYDFIVTPGADLSRIQIRYEGVDGLAITNDGSLNAISQFRPVYELTPYIYQEKNGQKKEIAGRYIIKAPGEFGFAIDGSYDPSIPIVIDPELVYSTYLGGNSYEWGSAIAVNYLGEVYVTGHTLSTDFPILNPYQPTIDSLYNDAFITRLNSEGNGIVSSTYLGGSTGSEDGLGIAIDDSGNIYVTGSTYSLDFPTVNPFQLYQQNCDAFVSKLTPDGDSLIYSTYIGANGQDLAYGLAIDRSGCAYITGITNSTSYPTKNPILTDMTNNDAFVTKLAPTGDSLIYSTYLGGNDLEMGYAIAVDKEGQAYVAGYTTSTDFPMVYSPQAHVYLDDVFVTKLNPAGSDFRYSTFIAGNMEDRAMALAIDDEGYAYIAGVTRSTDYPTLEPFQTFQYDRDAIVTKLAPTRCIIEYSTYLGGNAYDQGSGIAVDSRGNVYVTGATESSNFPIVNQFQSDQGYFDAFLTKFNRTDNSVEYSTYLGGTEGDYGYAIALDRNDNIYVSGATYSPDFPTLNPYLPNQPRSDIYVMKFSNTSDIDNNTTPIPNSHLLGNYPNPFNSNTLIQYQLSENTEVKVSIYNILGERIAELRNEYQEPGAHSLTWDASAVSSGTYLCRLEIGGKAEYSKMTLVK